MQALTFDNVCYRVNGRPLYLNSGEFHYFRVPKADWRERMRLFKEAGGNCLATYIPWALHEPDEGRFDFGSADGVTDLEGFLQAAHDVGLYVIARPGPYQYSELLYGGLPAWLIRNYPQLLARTLDGSIVGLPSVSYLHPLFLEKTHAWFAEVCPLIARHTVSRGGPVVFTQFDNELSGIHIWFGSLDFNPETWGFGQPNGRYAAFLRARYGRLERLNLLYDAAYADFADVRPTPAGQSGRPSEIRRHRDTFDAYLAMVAEYAQILCEWMREFGIDTPFIHNAANPEMNPYFLETAALLGDDFLLGSDHYYNLDQHWPQNNPTPQYARRVMLSMDMLRLMGYPPTILELPGGSASDWPPITAEDARACYFTNLAYGMKGHNYYIFTGGPNPGTLGETTDWYDYGAAISAEGEVRPLYQAQREVGDFIATHPWWPEAERAYDCRLALDFEIARSERYWRGGDYALSGPEAWQFLANGVLTSALCASFAPAGASLDADAWITDTATPLLVVSATAMSRAKQQRLVRFLEQGGRLLLTPVVPTLDEFLQPCTVLADFLDAPTLIPAGRSEARLTLMGVHNVLYGRAFLSPEIPSGARLLGHDEHSGRALAWELVTAGGGCAVFLGMLWAHAKHEHTSVMRALLAHLGAEPVVRCDNPNVWTSLMRAADHATVFVMNLFTAPMEASIEVTVGELRHDLGRIRVPAMTVIPYDL